MIIVKWWSEEQQAYYCQWDDNGSGYLRESDIEYESQRGDEVIWECS
ncbi:hypothetical protein NB537_00150 [Vibrio parahaemolyticus]|nr:hypothetical protein [Vibrio parahaemolyticus]